MVHQYNVWLSTGDDRPFMVTVNCSDEMSAGHIAEGIVGGSPTVIMVNIVS